MSGALASGEVGGAYVEARALREGQNVVRFDAILVNQLSMWGLASGHDIGGHVGAGFELPEHGAVGRVPLQLK